MKAPVRNISVWVFIMLLSVLLVSAKDKEKGKPAKDPKKQSARVDVDVFVDSHREMIRHHYVANPGSLPPGLAKRGGNLPPGLEKQLRRNGHLPPGLEKDLRPFPVELERRLPPLKPGLVRGIIGGSAVILDGKTKVVLDVFAVF